MFLTKKQLFICIFIPCILALFSFSTLVFSLLCAIFDTTDLFLIFLSFFEMFLSIVLYFSFKYRLGTNDLIAKGYKFIKKELCPAEYIKLYKIKRYNPANVICKPNFNVLHLLMLAYNSLNDNENSLKTADELISIAPKSKVNSAILLKASILFSIGNINEAERLMSQIDISKMNFKTKFLYDSVLKFDRAMAYKDYKTAEMNYLQILQKTNKLQPLDKLYAHHSLAIIYYNTEQFSKAVPHYSYCANNGGQTAIRTDAVKMLNTINQDCIYIVK